jgi:hypothetical protein
MLIKASYEELISVKDHPPLTTGPSKISAITMRTVATLLILLSLVAHPIFDVVGSSPDVPNSSPETATVWQTWPTR